jgi:hypothetical protein
MTEEQESTLPVEGDHGQAQFAKSAVCDLCHRGDVDDPQGRGDVVADRRPDGAGQRRISVARGPAKDADQSKPDPTQLDRNDAVDRIRRIQLNDLENVPFFLVSGFLYILTEPSLIAARLLLYGYVAPRGSRILPPISPRRPTTCGRRFGPSAR